MALVLVLTLTAGCVYFNTMFNAQRDFDAAKNLQKKRLDTRSSSILSLDEENLYKGVIRRCAKVLAEHPNSAWVDNALFLMGNAYFERAIYDSAGYKYDELLKYYPSSEWADDAYFIKGRALLSRSQFAAADSIFGRIVTELSGSDFADDARLMLAQSAFERNSLDSALVHYRTLIENYPRSSLIHDARQGVGDCYFREAQYEQALEAYHRLISEGRPPKPIWFQGVHRIGRCLLELGRFDEAGEHLNSVRKERLSPAQLAWIDIDLARVRSAQGDHQEAITALRDIARKNGKTEIGAEAAFRAGTIYQDKLDSLETAVKLYDQARREAPQAPAATEALIRTTGINRTAAGGAGADSTGRAARNQFILAELYYFRMNDVARAMDEYRAVVDNYPGSYWAANALYAMAHVVSSARNDPETAAALLDELIQDYPVSEFALLARNERGLEVDPAALDSLPRTRYIKAEKALLAGQDPQTAVAQLKRLAENDPASPYAPRSLLAAARAQESNGGDTGSAVETYRRIVELYPDFEGAGFARARLEAYEKQIKAEEAAKERQERQAPEEPTPAAPAEAEPAMEEPKQPAAAATRPRQTTAAPADTSGAEVRAPKISAPPELVEKAAPVYPPAALAAGIEGTVSLNVLIDSNGKVTRTVYLKGPKELTDAAIDAAKRSTYEPAYRNRKPNAAFLNVNFTFTLPKKTSDTGGEPAVPAPEAPQ